MPSPPPLIRVVSRCTVKARPGAHPRRCEMSLWDLSMFSVHYIQKGHLFSFPSHATPPVVVLLDRLKASLSLALRYFYPLAGRLAVEEASEGDGMYVHIDCDDRGAEFVHAAADGVTVADVLAPSDDVPAFVRGFFPLDWAVGFDGRTLPLLAVQVTELADGVFLGCSINHSVGDGTSFWNFFNAWAEVARSKEGDGGISRQPVHDRWFVEGGECPIKLPFSREEQFVERFAPPPLREKIFHFTAGSVAALKARANAECCSATEDEISSLQALSALVWRCITRLRRLPGEQTTRCKLAAENRFRLRPPLPADYFGNSIYPIVAETSAGELLAHGLGWAARLLRRCVASHTDGAIRGMVERWMESPRVYALSGFDRHSVMVGSSPRFDMYGCDFGWGRAVALRSGNANKFDGKVSTYPGREGGGSVDLEICLPPDAMVALEADQEFTGAVSVPAPI
uniref:Putative acetyltransferase At3g50280 n=1 Tax=Anthurium amnicola TaxID=1678845 RepID=A0A1D1Z0Y5_9ARAE